MPTSNAASPEHLTLVRHAFEAVPSAILHPGADF
jgi:hypothetical protein